jgi:N-acyl-D-aspartate/D-glutamate deacylase
MPICRLKVKLRFNQYNQAVRRRIFIRSETHHHGQRALCEQHQSRRDFEQQFSAFRTYDSTQMLTAVQDELIEQMVKEIADQIFNAT